MAKSYSQVSYGSRGSDVKTLQEMLNKNGYSLDVDGIFGSKTQSAVKDYQKKNKLAVDGIVGKNTWGALTTASTNTSGNAAAKPAATTAAADKGFSYDPYEKSDVVQQAEALLQQQMAQKPGGYQSAWQDQLNAIMDKIMNREEFSYDLDGDAIYQQYKGQAVQNGKMAMMDTMGQAQAMTGGYGNSYAQAVGQQAYQGQLQQLNEVIPELYQMALDQYNQKGQEMYDQASLLGTMEAQDYSRYRDQVSDYNAELARLTEDARYKAEDDYAKYIDGRDFEYGKYSDDRAYEYQEERDAVADKQWQQEFDAAQDQWQQEFDAAMDQWEWQKEQAEKETVVEPDDPTDNADFEIPGVEYDTHGYSTEEIKQLQKAAGITPDGIWGVKTQQAYEAGYRPSGKPTGFTGSTYKEAVAYLEDIGAPGSSNIMRPDEWHGRQASQQLYGSGGTEVTEFDTYEEYLRAYVEYQLDLMGK